MQKCLQKILLFIAVITVAGHSIIPHFHHEAQQAVEKHHHHDEEDDHHSIFSFAQLDENFVPAKLQVAGLELPVIYLITPVISAHLEIIASNSKAHFGYYREFPPPENYISKLPSRGPPSC